MTDQLTRTDLMTALSEFRNELRDLRHELRIDIVRLEAKIDSKPSLMAMFTGIVVVVFGMAGVIASTIATIHTLGFIK
jgi:hypothetical protein